MSDLKGLLESWQGQDQLSKRVQLAIKYRQDAEAGKLSKQELDDLLQDLKIMDDITLTSQELDKQIMFDDCINLLSKLPLP